MSFEVLAASAGTDATMNRQQFAELLSQHMRRIRASAADVAAEIGMSREAVNNWRNGDSIPGRRHRDRVLACARYLRLSEQETNVLLRAAGFEPEFPGDTERQEPDQAQSEPARSEVLAVFEQLQRLKPYPILMLLCPAHLGQPPERHAILVEAGRRFGRDRVLHLQPPYSLSPDTDRYFAALAAHCGLDGVNSDLEFETALSRRLREPAPLFCLVSRFEQAPPQHRDTLAGILRSLSEMHSGKLFLLICGGEGLASLKFEGGDLSLLNIAQTSRWPEPEAASLVGTLSAPGLDASACKTALAVSGAHPLLLAEAMRLLHEENDLSPSTLAARLEESDLLWTSFLPWLKHADGRQRLTALLNKDALGPVRPWLQDPDLRALYWSNLIVEQRTEAHTRVLVWRADLVRALGRRALHEANALTESGETPS
ncbi:helix-turn-helix domain-containing protein [Ahniella affigens]|uniref:helix-turn-helix domain-containing protein n=1 Tax=Ahniella affigens TaxID=2021234 RepID=UPI0011B23CF7|nr:helix-turn-helix transcriptional regulator [Ahniella affigens]